ITSEHSTLWRHIAALHSHRYRKWCGINKFDSMLAEDTKQRRAAAQGTSQQTQQTTLGDHFNPHQADVIPYSDRVFEAAAIEWLVQTNQPIQAFKHPAFKKMLDIASRATRGVMNSTHVRHTHSDKGDCGEICGWYLKQQQRI
ncbi:hypothetical protein EDB83DRAFT_2240894, partial [Lactarius deliciosus]